MGTESNSLTVKLAGNIIYPIRARSSAAEQAAHNRPVVGSNPAEPTLICLFNRVVDIIKPLSLAYICRNYKILIAQERRKEAIGNEASSVN